MTSVICLSSYHGEGTLGDGGEKWSVPGPSTYFLSVGWVTTRMGEHHRTSMGIPLRGSSYTVGETVTVSLLR